MLEAHALSFAYDKHTLFEDFSLTVEEAERVVLQAPSGFGKTTLCRILAGYLKPDTGKVLLDNAPLAQKGVCPVQMIMQHPEAAVDPRLRMRETLKEAGEVPEDLLERFKVNPSWLNRYPHELSGGELQRICIVRALTTKPRYLIADELSTMLDAVTQAAIWNALLAEAREQHFGMIVVTHSPALAKRIATRTVDLCEQQ